MSDKQPSVLYGPCEHGQDYPMNCAKCYPEQPSAMSDKPQRSERFFVHRYKYSHESKRRKARAALKAGKARIVMTDRDGWLYERIKP